MYHVEKVSRKILRKIYKNRNSWSHKYNYGHLLVIGGSKHYSGSPAFNALAALRAGVDLVTIVAPKRTADIIAGFEPDLIAYPLDCDYFSVKDLREVLDFTKGKTAVVIGGGMGRRGKTLEFIKKFIAKVDIPMVIDADAIHAIASKPRLLKNKQIVLTPHTYEFFILSGRKLGTKLEERVNAVKNFASTFDVTVLLKGHADVISDGNRIVINQTGTPYMTKGGLGDCLAGIVGALLARGVDCFTAASAAAWINGKAGEFAAKKFGEGLLASDVIECIPLAIK